MPAPNRADNLARTTPPCPKTSPWSRPCRQSIALVKWQVKLVVHHRDKITHSTKLQFRVQYEPHENKVSPDTWIPWNQVRWLIATQEYN